ncbi:hypothetical protein CHARACLAT_019429 [Characodon lateralis]|uniref:Uncharacterized protein n=1 Tax=Characodon lateralis TaxID=208331 RepID=A0ABU7CRT5_9TELE|nr:hypothetical protein [Characodon lateralis]
MLGSFGPDWFWCGLWIDRNPVNSSEFPPENLFKTPPGSRSGASGSFSFGTGCFLCRLGCYDSSQLSKQIFVENVLDQMVLEQMAHELFN